MGEGYCNHAEVCFRVEQYYCSHSCSMNSQDAHNWARTVEFFGDEGVRLEYEETTNSWVEPFENNFCASCFALLEQEGHEKFDAFHASVDQAVCSWLTNDAKQKKKAKPKKKKAKPKAKVKIQKKNV